MGENVVTKIVIKVFSVVLFVVLLTTTQALATTVSLADVVVEPDGVVTLPIVVDNITDYGTGTMNVWYDPSVVHVASVAGSSDSGIAVKNINNTIGFVRIVASNTGGASGNIIFANAEFMAVGLGSTPLNIDIDVLRDTSHNAISASINDGSITVPQPLKSFLIRGHVSYGNGTPCNTSTVNITNLNNGRKWTAETSGNYYQISLTSGIDLNASEILRFGVTDGVYSNIADHTVIGDEVDDGGLFEFNLTLGQMPGDVTGDGHLTTTDATIVLQMAVRGEYSEAADVSRDNAITSLDALMILRAADKGIEYEG